MVSVWENVFFFKERSLIHLLLSLKDIKIITIGGNLGTNGHTKTDEFSEKFQMAFDPPPHFRKIIFFPLQFHLGWGGGID